MIGECVTGKLARVPLSIYIKIYSDTHVHKHLCPHILVQSDDRGVRETKTCACTSSSLYENMFTCGVATISRLRKIIGLFCQRALYKRRYSAKETYKFKEPINRSHPIHIYTNTHAETYSCNPMIREFVLRELVRVLLSLSAYISKHTHTQRHTETLMQSNDEGVRATKTCEYSSLSLCIYIQIHTYTHTYWHILMQSDDRGVRDKRFARVPLSPYICLHVYIYIQMLPCGSISRSLSRYIYTYIDQYPVAAVRNCICSAENPAKMAARIDFCRGWDPSASVNHRQTGWGLHQRRWSDEMLVQHFSSDRVMS